MWNGGGQNGGPPRNDDSSNPARPPVSAISTRDQQQLDAVAALASFSQVASTLNGAGNGFSNGVPPPHNVSRQYSDTSSHHSGGSAPGDFATTRAPYYAPDSHRGGGAAGFLPYAQHHEGAAAYHRSIYGDQDGGYYTQAPPPHSSHHSNRPGSTEPPATMQRQSSSSGSAYPDHHHAYEGYARQQQQQQQQQAASSSSAYPPPHYGAYESSSYKNAAAGGAMPPRERAATLPPEHQHSKQAPSAATAAATTTTTIHQPNHLSSNNASGDTTAKNSASAVVYPPAPRGKPEAMARALAASAIEEQQAELLGAGGEKDQDSSLTLPPKKKKSSKKASGSASSKTSGTSKKAAAATSPKQSKKSSSKSKAHSALPTSPSVLLAGAPSTRGELTLFEKAPPISDAEYQNLEELMTQFCRVPLLAEFSRPVALLHPELAAAYAKIVTHPVDLGRVCRGIRRRQYLCLRDVRLDTWRVFANCVKYNSHPSNKDAVPSFVSIALHLREYFNYLWQEYMIPSDLPLVPKSSDEDSRAAFEVQKKSHARREKERQKRLENSGVLVLSDAFTQKMAARLLNFIATGGLVDLLDTEPILGNPEQRGTDVDVVIQRLKSFHNEMMEVVRTPNAEYTVDAYYKDLRKCYTEDVLEDEPALRNRIAGRLDRLFWKYAIPLHEANSRGVTQSSIWGNIAAVIWARESSKKTYWPALCLGILPPPDQREGWHAAVTERNENRLPDRLRAQLKVAKRRCEQAQQRQSMSYFLVEFMGTHEFIWVRETDIIENFDPEDDPNKNKLKTEPKTRWSRLISNVLTTPMYASALEECQWANAEYENVLQDAFEFADDDRDEDDDEDENYSFPLLAQSDDEADNGDKYSYKYVADDMGLSDVDEANYLLSHDGMLDTSADGRKNAKKRTQEMKKQATAAKKKEAVQKQSPAKRNRSTSPGKGKKSSTSEKKTSEKKSDKRSDKKESKKADKKEVKKGNKKEQKDLERRRKKRTRELEKFMKNEAKKKGKRKRSAVDDEEDERGLARNKRARATAVVNAYLLRWAKDDDSSKSLALNGVMGLPAAMVDSTGLLGMALAFRAASGELAMPDDGEEKIAKSKPWAAIDSETPNKSSDRTTILEKQIELIEKEVGRVRKDAEKRKLLALEYAPKRRATEQRIEEDNALVRGNPLWKKKKSMSAKTDHSTEGSPRGSEKSDVRPDGGADIVAVKAGVVATKEKAEEIVADTKPLDSAVTHNENTARAKGDVDV